MGWQVWYTHVYVSVCVGVYTFMHMCILDGEGSRVFAKVIVASKGLSNI